MGTRDTLLRTMHDAGAAAWFGGSLMGAVGLNGAAADAKDPRERTRLSADGWMRWTQKGVGANTVIKTALTATALGLSAYGAILGAKVAKAADQAPAEGATEPSAETPEEIAAAQRQLKAIQWATPVLTGAIVALGAQQGEMQRPRAQVRQLMDSFAA